MELVVVNLLLDAVAEAVMKLANSGSVTGDNHAPITPESKPIDSPTYFQTQYDEYDDNYYRWQLTYAC